MSEIRPRHDRDSSSALLSRATFRSSPGRRSAEAREMAAFVSPDMSDRGAFEARRERGGLREVWNRGVATAALTAFLDRPGGARATDPRARS